MMYVVHLLLSHRTDRQGLEAFKLVEKMGDGAFSNVYKAIERKTGRKVAVKVVRKYELNSSQVRITCPVHIRLPALVCPAVPWPGRSGSRVLYIASLVFL